MLEYPRLIKGSNSLCHRIKKNPDIAPTHDSGFHSVEGIKKFAFVYRIRRIRVDGSRIRKKSPLTPRYIKDD